MGGTFRGDTRIQGMGEVRVSVCLRGLGRPAKGKARRMDVDAVVDTGAVLILLPREIVERLGLRRIDRRGVVLADGRKLKMDLVGPMALTIAGRTMMTDCLVGPRGCEPLVGQIVLEHLDLIVDPLRRTLTPRPDSPFIATVNLKTAHPAAALTT